jgi:peptide/nickel transport system substrate-binding protein
MRMRLWLLAILATILPSVAETFRWSAQGSYASMDPHAQTQVITNQLNAQIYDRLIMLGKKLEHVPALAESWKRVNATVWIFNLRKDVKWHDGSDFTAEDVVFSIERAKQPTSGFRSWASAMGTPRALDKYTVELTTPVPYPALPDAAALIFIMSKAWCANHRVEVPQDLAQKQETYASRNAMGTGPFTVVTYEPDVKLVVRKNPNWWGLKFGLFEGNVTEVVFTPIASDATRLAALISGGIDFVIDPSPQDVERLRQDRNVRVFEGPETSAFFLGMDQNRVELLYSNVKGRNPFKDVRVRRAIERAIDPAIIVRAAMRGNAVPTSLILTNPQRSGVTPELDRRAPADLAVAKKLLADAGYPNGFTVTMDCDARTERVCTAIVGMLAKAGITVNLLVAPATQYYQKIRRLDTSFFLVGWVSALDPIFLLRAHAHSRNQQGDGEWNLSNFKDEKLDAIVDELKSEFDEGRRKSLAIEAATLVRDNAYLIALYRRLAPWAARNNIELVHLPNVWLEPRWVQVHKAGR